MSSFEFEFEFEFVESSFELIIIIIERNGHDVIHISFLYRVCACTTVEEITYSTGIPAAMARVTSAE